MILQKKKRISHFDCVYKIQSFIRWIILISDHFRACFCTVNLLFVVRLHVCTGISTIIKKTCCQMPKIWRRTNKGQNKYSNALITSIHILMLLKTCFCINSFNCLQKKSFYFCEIVFFFVQQNGILFRSRYISDKIFSVNLRFH